MLDAPAPAALDPLPDDGSSIVQPLDALLRTVRRHLHQNPELGFQEHDTSRYVREVLEMHGLKVHGIAGTGLYVDIDPADGDPARRVGYRADIDALPIQDAKDVPYRSRRPGVAHLCGHDAHTAVGIGVALLLHRMRDRLPGGARVFFQPNEEGVASGAPVMIRDGVLDGLEAVYAIHVDPTLASGRYGLIEGACTAAADRFSVFVRSDSTGHSARPHLAVDTVYAATQIASALYGIVGRLTDARNASVLTVCRFRAGEAFNVIPAEVEFGGTLRSTDPEDRARINALIREVAAGTGALYGADVEVEIEAGPPPVLNDGRLVRTVEGAVRELFGDDAVYRIPRPSMGSEDFAHYLAHVPGILVRAGTSDGPATSHALHDACFDLDETRLAPTARVMADVLRRHLAG